MFRWAKASFRGKRKDESGKKEKKSLAVEKKKSKNVFTACAKSGALEPPYEKSGGTTPDSKKVRGSKESEDLSLRKRSSGSHATAARTQSLLVSNSPSESKASAARGKSDTRSMSELRDAGSKQPENKTQNKPNVEIKTGKSDVGVDECIISETKKPCTSELPMNNCNGLRNDAQKPNENKGTQSNGPISSTKTSKDINEAAPLNSANEVGDMHVKQPGKEGSVVPPPNEVTGKSRVGSVTRDDLPCDRLQSSVCGGPASEDSGGRSTLPTQLSQPSGDEKVSSAPVNSSKVPAVVEKSSATVVKSLKTSATSSAFSPKESVSLGKISPSLGADCEAKSACDNGSEKCKAKDVAHDKKAHQNADVKQKNADAHEGVLPDILTELKENIIACSDLPDAGVLSHKTVLYKETEHGGKVTYEVGGASGKEINVTFGDDFNRGEVEEVVEKPIVKKHFTPLTADPPKKTDDDAKITKEYSTTASASLGGEKEFVLDNILADIVDAKVVDAPLSKKVLSVSKTKDGSIVRETGGTSGKEVNVTFQSAHFSEKGENVIVDEDVIVKERFSPLGSEDKLTLDNLPYREKSVIESAVKRRFGQYDSEPSQNKASSDSPLLGKSEKELIAADLKEDLDPFWSELDSSLASAIASASKETKKSSPSPPVRDEVLHQEPVDHVRRSPKDAFDESTHQPLQSSTAQVLRALDSLKKASTETAEKSSANVQLPSASAEIPVKERSVSYSLSASSALLSKNGSFSFVKANTTQGPELFDKSHCSANSEPLVVSTSSGSVSGAAKSETVSSTKAPLSPSTCTSVENTSVNPGPTPAASDPATVESPPSPSCDCDMNGQLSRTGRHRDKCVRFSSLDLSPHSRSVGCYPIKEEPSSPLRPAVVSKPSLPKLLNKGSELRATLAEEEEFDDIEIADERSSPISDAPEKKKAEEPEISGVSKSPVERHPSLGRRFRSEKNGIVANIIGNFESSPLQGSSANGGAVRSPKNISPLKPKEEFGSVKEHSKVTYTFSKDYDGSKAFKTDPKRETSPKPEKPVKDYRWIKHVENKEKKETSPKLEKILFDYKWIKPIEKVEKQTTFSSGDKSQKIKTTDVHDSPASETKTAVKKNTKEEECVAPIQITVTEASPEKKTTVVENGDHDMSASRAENIPDVKTTELEVAKAEDSQIADDTKTLQTETSVEESSNTSTPEMSTQELECPKIEPSGTTAKLPETSIEISRHDDEVFETEIKTTPSTAPKLDSPEVRSEPIPSFEDAEVDVAKDAEIVDVQDEGMDEKTRTDLELDMNSDSSAIESKIPNGFTTDEKQEDENRPCISEPSEARVDEEKKTPPPETEVEADIKPPTVVQPSTEFYLNPCKELLASSMSNAEPEIFQKKSLNPFGDSEDEVEDTITVILSSSKSPVRTPTKSLNPFDEEEEDELNENHENGESSPTGMESLRTSTPSPLPRTTVPPVPTPRASKQGIGGSNLSLHSLDPRNLSENWPYTLKSPLNVSTLSTKSLNPFDESEEEEESRGSFQRHHMSNLSVQGDMRVNMMERGKLRGSLPARRRKRRAPLPPGMQAPSPSPAHGPLTSSPSTPVGLFRSATSSLQQSSIQESPIYATQRNGSLDRSAAQKNKNLHESPVFGGRRNLSASRSISNSPNTGTNGLGIPMGGSRRSTWGSSPRKVPPPRPPPPSPSALKNSK